MEATAALLVSFTSIYCVAVIATKGIMLTSSLWPVYFHNTSFYATGNCLIAL